MLRGARLARVRIENIMATLVPRHCLSMSEAVGDEEASVWNYKVVVGFEKDHANVHAAATLANQSASSIADYISPLPHKLHFDMKRHVGKACNCHNLQLSSTFDRWSKDLLQQIRQLVLREWLRLFLG